MKIDLLEHPDLEEVDFAGRKVLGIPHDGTHAGMMAIRNKVFAIGGSDIGSILGVGDFRSRSQVLFHKLGIGHRPDENMANFLGNYLEEPICELWRYLPPDSNQTQLIKNFREGNAIKDIKFLHHTFVNPDYPYLAMNLDYAITRWEGRPEYENGEWGIGDAKKIAGWKLKKYDHGHIPQYMCQIQGYAMGLESPHCTLGILVDGMELIEKRYAADGELQAHIDAECTRFFDAMCRAREICREHGYEPGSTEPLENGDTLVEALIDIAREVDAYPDSDEILADLHYISARADRKGTEEQTDWARRSNELAKSMKKMEVERKDLLTKLRQSMVEIHARRLDLPGFGYISWKKAFRVYEKQPKKGKSDEVKTT